MNRPWQVAIMFGAALAVLLTAMAAISRTALRLERNEAVAQAKLNIEVTIWLALWRMESALKPLMAHESARSFEAYSPIVRAEGPTVSSAPEACAQIELPSPLLTEANPFVLVHFQFDPGGELTSPQYPSETDRVRLTFAAPLQARIEAARFRLAEMRRFATREVLLNELPLEEEVAGLPVYASRLPTVGAPVQSVAGQVARGVAEWRARDYANIYQAKQLQAQAQELLATTPTEQPAAGSMRGIWIGDQLVLARRVDVGADTWVQGCWLDWPNLRRYLLANVTDLFPSAALEPIRDDAVAMTDRRLAALPVGLVSNADPKLAAAGRSPVGMSLGIAWLCALLAVTAVAVLLIGTVSLSERRAAFVSAVTHELRTPLTTFRLYTELLSSGMVQDEEKRRTYLQTLQREAIRLGHLVENVLAYARLERGRAAGKSETLTVDELLSRVEGRLAERAEQVGMKLRVELNGAADVRVRADSSVVEQVLFNLVDNACKYAVHAQDKTILLEATTQAGAAALRVRDFGPGIDAVEARRLFRPFRKSARDAAHSAPGVGLGLALSRRLAREMNGDLTVTPTAPSAPGACFTITLPKE